MARTKASSEVRSAGRRVARRLSGARRRSGLTASAVAQRAGLSVDTVRAIEGGRVANPGFLTVAAIADVVGTDLDGLAAAAKGRRRAWPKHGA